MNIGSKGQDHNGRKSDGVAGMSYALYRVPALSGCTLICGDFLPLFGSQRAVNIIYQAVL